MAFRRLAEFAALQTGQPGIRLAVRHVQAGELVFVPCFKRRSANGLALFFAIQEFGDRFAQDPVWRAITGFSQLLKPVARGFVQFDRYRSDRAHACFLLQGIIK